MKITFRRLTFLESNFNFIKLCRRKIMKRWRGESTIIYFYWRGGYILEQIQDKVNLE